MTDRHLRKLERPTLGLGLRLGLSGGGRHRYSPPPGLPALPINVTGVNDYGSVNISPSDAITAGIANRSAIYNTGVYYLKPSTGSDSNDGLTELTPFATVAKAMRTATGAASTVKCLENCTLPTFDVRNTDASQLSGNGFPNGQMKILDANGFTVIVRDTVTDLQSTTWTQDGTYSNWWKTGAIAAGSQSLRRVVRTDQLDTEGYSKGLLKLTSAPASNGVTPAYYWDSVGKIAWVNLGGADVEASKAVLRGFWLNSGGVSRILNIGSALCLQGIRTEGVQLVQLDGGSRRPDFWLHDTEVLWSPGKGIDGTNTGYIVTTNTVVHSSEQDNIGAGGASATGRGLVLTANSRFTRAGDLNTFATDETFQGESAHGGSDHVAWGNAYQSNNGQGVADTCLNSSADTSWLVGCDFTGGLVAGSANIEVGSAATSASRKMYIDTCRSTTPGSNGDLKIATNGSAFVRNTTLASVTGGTTTPY